MNKRTTSRICWIALSLLPLRGTVASVSAQPSVTAQPSQAKSSICGIWRAIKSESGDDKYRNPEGQLEMGFDEAGSVLVRMIDPRTDSPNTNSIRGTYSVAPPDRLSISLNGTVQEKYRYSLSGDILRLEHLDYPITNTMQRIKDWTVPHTGLTPLPMLPTSYLTSAQLLVTVLPSKTAGEKVIVPLAIKNGLPEKVDSARAVMFLFNERGKVVGQSTHWIIGGETNRPALPVGGTNTYQFVVPKGGKEFVTNRLTVTHVKLSSGKTANPVTEVEVRYEPIR